MKFIVVLLLALSTFGCGYGSNYNGGSGTGATPRLSQLAPSSVTSGSAGFVLTVNGTGFTTTSVVFFNGVAHTTMFVTNRQLAADIPASDIANPATIPVHVRTTGGQYGMGVNSNTVDFIVN